MTEHEYSRARIARDRNFDGKFFFAVKTTGIFCRPSCPSPRAKEENVTYFDSIFQALEAGFRPCLRCRPDIAIEYGSGYPSSHELVNDGLRKIYDGYLNYHSLNDLAGELGVSDRHLRQLFVERLGVPPVKIARYHKAMFARKMLLMSDNSVTDIAAAAGFGSLRQFNEVFKAVFNTNPTAMRKESRICSASQENTSLLLKYEPPFDFKLMLSFMRERALTGVEVITQDSYSRTFRTAEAKGYFTVTDDPGESALRMSIFSDDIKCYMEIYNRVRRMFDLDTDFRIIREHFRDDPLLEKGMKDGLVPRLPKAYDPFEFMIRAILGQQVTVKAATTMAGRIVAKAGLRCLGEYPKGLDYFFPDAKELAGVELDGVGLTNTRCNTINAAVQAVLGGSVKLTSNQSFEDFHRDFSVLKGIGDWTVNYVAMRGLGLPDSFPAGDLGVIKALSADGTKISVKEVLLIAEKWRPYRSYATLCLWNSLGDK
ncbi:DNA-3-methyladenine glycosylase 2 family protein [Desulfovibrio sp. JC022]|uniref:DNA-3-methyladenine glycosylase 2 family protein n=1 Tax=Desulfovibrio sp. JC022 TaxID=2593642 RepID=UPI0013D7EDC5|nr:DNA-3-methyladenine glycosylase 2 [Desulfovibrio sp. JC022]NDV21397.1 DNA-3-methyladenine glycosylase 2 family protein [Desulfovibrio sp. JC022]